jgi:hypothetical protein
MRSERLQQLSQELSYQLLTRLAYVLEPAHTAAATLGVLATHLQVLAHVMRDAGLSSACNKVPGLVPCTRR